MEQLLKDLLGNELLVYLLMAFVPLLWVIPYALFAVWLERKVSAHMQDRVGPMRVGGWHGWAQTIADILKLIQKEDIVPAAADYKLHFLAPYVVFIGSYAAFAAIPFSSAFIGSNLNIGLFYIVAVSSLAVVGILMAGWSSNNKWSLFGAMRSAAQIVSYEIPTALSLLVAVMLVGSLNLQEITAYQEGGIQNWIVFGGPASLPGKFILMPFTFVAFLILFVASLAETNRTPFDLPEGESELVAGFMVEYSSTPYLLFMLGEYVAIVTMCALTTILFLGGWLPPFDVAPFTWVPGVIWFVIKTCLVFFMFSMVKAFVPRYRYDQLMRLGWKVFLPISLVMVVAVAAVLQFTGLGGVH